LFAGCTEICEWTTMEHRITPGDAGCGQTWVKPLGRLAA
jgi:hypothetical protein